MFSLTIVLIKFKTLKFETKPLKCFCHFQTPLNRACKALPPHLTTLSPITGGLGHCTLFEQTELSSSSLDHRPSVHGTSPVKVILWRQRTLCFLSACPWSLPNTVWGSPQLWEMLPYLRQYRPKASNTP